MNFRKPNREFLKLAGALLLVPLIAWALGFRQTYRLWKENRDLQERLTGLVLHMKPDRDTGQEDTQVEKQVLSNGKLLEYLTPTVKENEVSIVKYTPYLTRVEGDLQVYTGELVLSGGFIALLKVLDVIGHREDMGKIVSLAFRTEQDRLTKRKDLKLILIVQQLSKIETIKE